MPFWKTPLDTIYIEHTVADLPRVQAILARYPQARRIPIERHGDVFNAPGQDFRAQKANTALILAHKHGRRVLATPPDYGLGGQHNYYFSHMMNCVYDCRYCYLQGMYRSGNYVLFVNDEGFFADVDATLQTHAGEPVWFFSGYDCDSLALEPLTGFAERCVEHFAVRPLAHLELRTKSTQVRGLLRRTAVPNVVVAFSLSPEAVVAAEEHRTPTLAKRLEALRALQDHGWPIGLRFDPLLKADNFEALYGELFDQTFAALDATRIHSVSLGQFRLPKGFYKRMVRLHPDARVLAASLDTRGSMVSYENVTEQRMLGFCEAQLLARVPAECYHPCVSIG